MCIARQPFPTKTFVKQENNRSHSIPKKRTQLTFQSHTKKVGRKNLSASRTSHTIYQIVRSVCFFCCCCYLSESGNVRTTHTHTKSKDTREKKTTWRHTISRSSSSSNNNSNMQLWMDDAMWGSCIRAWEFDFNFHIRLRHRHRCRFQARRRKTCFVNIHTKLCVCTTYWKHLILFHKTTTLTTNTMTFRKCIYASHTCRWLL